MTALLLVTYGTAGQDALLADRLVETLLGAVVGFTVNAVVLPPLYLRGPALADQLTAEDGTFAAAEAAAAELRTPEQPMGTKGKPLDRRSPFLIGLTAALVAIPIAAAMLLLVREVLYPCLDRA